jgi:hypothetical protein
VSKTLHWFFAEGPGSFVALIAGVVALLFTLFPELKPFTPTNLSASVDVITVDRAVTRDQWRWRVAVGDRTRHDELERADRQAAKSTSDEPCGTLGAAPGFTIYVATDAEGFKERELTVRAALYDVATGQRVADPEQFRALATVPVEAPTSSSVQEVWLYDPGTAQRYFVRIQLYDSNDHLLHIVRSKPFARISDKELHKLPKDCTRAI